MQSATAQKIVINLLKEANSLILKERILFFTGLFFLLLPLPLNPVTLAWRAGLTLQEMQGQALRDLLALDFLSVAIGGVLAFRWSRNLFRMAIASPRLREWIWPDCAARIIPGLLPSVTVALVFFGLVCTKLGWKVTNPAVLPVIIQQALLTGLCVQSAVLAVGMVASSPWVRMLGALPWAILLPLELLTVGFGAGRFEMYMVGWISTQSILPLISAATIGTLVAGGALILTSGFWTGAVIGKKRSAALLLRSIILVAVIGAIDPSFWLVRVETGLLNTARRADYKRRQESCVAISGDPVLRLSKLLLKGDPAFRELTSLGDQAHTANALGIGVEMPPPASLGLQPFRRVVFVTCESLSLPLISRYNPMLPGQLTPFLDSCGPGFTNIWTCSAPTTAGLASHYCSHPNSRLVVARKHPNSLARLLGKEGWRTAVFQSCSTDFDDSGSHFMEMGFQEVFSAEWLCEHGHSQYNYDWGVCDRITMDEALQYLQNHRDEKVFVGICTIDTHLPSGRKRYGDLVYPKEPDWVASHPSSKLLRSFFRMDYDLGIFISKLKSSGLFDEQTLVVITADHCCPPFKGITDVPGLRNSRIERIPWFCLSGRKLPEVDYGAFGDQTSSAPTLAHLLGLKPAAGWWGHSLFDKRDRPVPFITDLGADALSQGTNATELHSSDRAVLELYNSVVVPN